MTTITAPKLRLSKETLKRIAVKTGVQTGLARHNTDVCPSALKTQCFCQGGATTTI